MIDAYVCKGPNPLKLQIFLEEVPIPHRYIWLDLSVGDHRTSAYLEISPNAKVPAIIDRAPAGGGAPAAVFESGAILLYLAEKTGLLIPSDVQGRAEVLKWLFWQVAALGPFAGQAVHFRYYAPQGIQYALTRYDNEIRRLFGVLDRNLADREYVATTYSIADIVSYPFISAHRLYGIDIQEFPRLGRWLASIESRPAVIRAQQRIEKEAPPRKGTPEQYRKNLFNDHCADGLQPR